MANSGNVVFNGIGSSSDWDGIQARTVDPYSYLSSDLMNRFNSVYDGNGTGTCLIRGLDLVRSLDDSVLDLTIHKGVVIKDYVLIEFTEDVKLTINNTNDDFRSTYLSGNSVCYLVVDYKYEKIKPAPIASLQFIKSSAYDPERHMILHTFIFDTDGSVSSITQNITPKNNVVYDELLTELKTCVKAAMNDSLAALGVEGISDLLKVHLKTKGTSIGGSNDSTTYYYIPNIISKTGFKDILTVETHIKDLNPKWVEMSFDSTINYDNKSFKCAKDVFDVGDKIRITYSYDDGSSISYLDPIECTVNSVTYLEGYYVIKTSATTLKEPTDSDYSIFRIETYQDNIYYTNKYVITSHSAGTFDVNTTFESTAADKNERCKLLIYDCLDSNCYTVYLAVNDDITGYVEAFVADYEDEYVNVLELENQSPDVANESLVWSSDSVTNLNTSTYVNGHKIWNESNDGLGSGLDADLLDGRHIDYFASKSELTDTNSALTDSINEVSTNLSNHITNANETFIRKDWMDKAKNTTDNSGGIITNGIAVLDVNGKVPQKELNINRLCNTSTDGENPNGIEINTNTGDSANPTGTGRLNVEANLYATRVYNPAYKDVAECFETNPGISYEACKNRIMSLDYESGKARLSQHDDKTVLGVVSDTYGLLLGGTQDQLNSGNVAIVPLAMCGTVWVELEDMEENINYYGCLVGPGDNGYGRIVAKGDRYSNPYIGMIVEYSEDSNLVKILVRTGF